MIAMDIVTVGLSQWALEKITDNLQATYFNFGFESLLIDVA